MKEREFVSVVLTSLHASGLLDEMADEKNVEWLVAELSALARQFVAREANCSWSAELMHKKLAECGYKIVPVSFES